jgi:hypothetical protein
MPTTPDPIKMPGGYPNLTALKSLLTPEKLDYLHRSPEHSAYVKQFAARLAKEPLFMKHAEAMLKAHGADLEGDHIIKQFASFGWEPGGTEELPSAKHAAAAVAAAVAAMVVPVPVPV